jgi:NAD(P)-dependent dehydrogenase (short-subunit alcohol dehydrogenase family)
VRVDLSGKTVIITGAASGVGRGIALQAAESGASGLFLTDRNGEGCRETLSEVLRYQPESASIEADLIDPGAPGIIVSAALERFGRVDGLVNAAGLTTRASFHDGTIDAWDALFAVNARAPFFLMQAVIDDMLKRRASGSVVNILSVNAHCGSPELAIYSATKGALQTLTKNAANAYMADGIRVNGINLGWVLSEAEHRMQSETLGQGENWASVAAANLPLGRLLTPEETARLAVFLLSDTSAPLSGVAIDLEQKVTGAIH